MNFDLVNLHYYFFENAWEVKKSNDVKIISNEGLNYPK